MRIVLIMNYKHQEKRIIASLHLDSPNKITFKNFSYNHPDTSARFSFFILIVPFKEQLIKELKPDYKIKKKRKEYVLEIDTHDCVKINEGQSSKFKY